MDNEVLYLRIEITEDVVFDNNQDPLKLWWNHDYVEIFIDKDHTRGLHQYNHNVFAYQMVLDGNVVDLGQDKQPKLFYEHAIFKYKTVDPLTAWEIKANVFEENYK